jgi:ABC-type bacteriocin/lantibiotic exporter with double-glycine peptidase domain
MEAIERLMKNRTTFMIAHRLSTLEKCDIVLVMKDGRLNMITSDLAEAKNQLMQTEVAPVRPNQSPMGPVLVN